MNERPTPTAERPRNPEHLGYQEGLIALQSRMLIGGIALNPDLRTIPEISENNINDSQRRGFTYLCLDRGSTDERKTYWHGKEGNDFEKQKQRWVQETVQAFTSASDFFEKSDKGKRWTTLFGQLGIQTNHFNEEQAHKIYERFFIQQTQENTTPTLRYARDVAQLYYNQQTKSVDHAALKENLDGIQWLAHIFGDKSSQVTAQLIEAEVKAMHPELRKQLVEQANEKQNDHSRINDLKPKEDELLRFLWNHQPTERDSDAPAPAPRPPQSTPTPETPGENQPETPGWQPQEQAALPDRPMRLEEMFQLVQGRPDRNHRFWVDNPPEHLDLNEDQLKALESRLPYWSKYTVGDRDFFLTNTTVSPWAKELGLRDDLLSPEALENRRFLNGEMATHGDSGLFGVSAAASETPEKQAQLYKTLSTKVIDVHKHNPRLLKEWIDVQASHQIGIPNVSIKVPLEIFENNDFVDEDIATGKENPRLRPENERLLYFDEQKNYHPDEKHYKIDNKDGFWGKRVQQLEDALQQNQLRPHHLRWIEFLSHSVDVPKLIDLMKAQQEHHPDEHEDDEHAHDAETDHETEHGEEDHHDNHGTEKKEGFLKGLARSFREGWNKAFRDWGPRKKEEPHPQHH